MKVSDNEVDNLLGETESAQRKKTDGDKKEKSKTHDESDLAINLKLNNPESKSSQKLENNNSAAKLSEKDGAALSKSND